MSSEFLPLVKPDAFFVLSLEGPGSSFYFYFSPLFQSREFSTTLYCTHGSIILSLYDSSPLIPLSTFTSDSKRPSQSANVYQHPILPPPQTKSSKRGLVHVPSSDHPGDDSIWITPPTTLTWYYNYDSSPTSSLSSSNLSFVPMLWGDHNSTFVEDVRGQKDVKWVLGFNEPDMGSNVGGSNIRPERAAELWKRDIEPLKGDGKELGAPSVSGSPIGTKWLKEFFKECDGCSVDFIPIHWYGNFEGLASHVGEIRAAFPNKTIWVTEFGWADQPLAPTQSFFNTTLEYLDRLDYVTHYSWFGSFRSDVSNVGPNGAMLNSDGEVTDIGAWYLGRRAEGIKPDTGNSASRIGRGDWLLWGIVYFITSVWVL